MADPTDDPDAAKAPSGAPLPNLSAHEEGDARAAEQGMAKAGQGAAVEHAEAAAGAFVEKDVSLEQASGPNGGEDGSAVNSQASETVAMANVLLGEGAPAIAGAGLAQVAAQAAGLALLNAVNAQQNAYVTANAAVAAIVARILAIAPPHQGGRADG